MNSGTSLSRSIHKFPEAAAVLVWVFVSVLPHVATAQTDTTKNVIEIDRGHVEGEVVQPRVESPEVKYHSPRKATLMSVALPGLGQVYNKKWWKVPIIYGGFAVAGYFLKDNLDNIDYYAAAYRAATDFSPTQLSDIVNQYKQWRDLSYIAIGAIYILNIVDANVDAHLFHFDVSEDISMHVQPYVSPGRWGPVGMGGGSAGLTLSLKL